MRVTYVLHTTAWGGAETYVARLVHELAVRITPVVVTSRPAPERLLAALPSGVEVRTVDGVGRKGDLTAFVRLVKAVRATKPDLVHVNQSTPAHNRYGLLAGRLSGAATLTTVHSPEPVSSRLQALLLPAVYRGVHTVITVSDETHDLLVSSLRVAPDAVRVVLNGVPIPPTRRPPRRQKVFRAGTLGRLVREKGFDVLLDALALLDPDHRVHLQIGGDGPERPALESRAMGLPVTFAGEILDTASFLRQLDVFCLSSRREGLPFALLEAMAMGVPCIATDVGQVRSAVGSAVLVVPAEQPQELALALQRLAADPAARESLGARGRALVEATYDVRTMADSTMKLYEAAATRVRREPSNNEHL